MLTLYSLLSLLSLLAVVGDQFDLMVRHFHAPHLSAKCEVDLKLVEEFSLDSTARALCWQLCSYHVNTQGVANVALTTFAALALGFLPSLFAQLTGT
jgi:hypothetical protein